MASYLRAVYPDLSPTEMTVPVDVINKYIGVQLPGQQIADSLAKMALSGALSDDGRQVHVRVPPTRCDVLHACDDIEVYPCLPPSLRVLNIHAVCCLFQIPLHVAVLTHMYRMRHCPVPNPR